jgi:hypothetical protein
VTCNSDSGRNHFTHARERLHSARFHHGHAPDGQDLRASTTDDKAVLASRFGTRGNVLAACACLLTEELEGREIGWALGSFAELRRSRQKVHRPNLLGSFSELLSQTGGGGPSAPSRLT